MGSVTVGSDTYTIYGTQADATSYLNGTLHASSAWTAATPDQQARALVTATRLIDRKPWVGILTDPNQDLKWPRTGVVYADGSDVDTIEVPLEVEQATYELAALLLADPAGPQATGVASNIQSASAGPASVSFFAPSTPTALPPGIITELLEQFMAGTDATLATYGGGVTVYGTWTPSEFDDCDTLGLRRG